MRVLFGQAKQPLRIETFVELTASKMRLTTYGHINVDVITSLKQIGFIGPLYYASMCVCVCV